VTQIFKINILLLFTFCILIIDAKDQFPSSADVTWAKQFDSISGPGVKVIGDGRGGWVSGSSGVSYKGYHPKPSYKLSFDGKAKGLAIDSGLTPPIRPAIELHLRDGVVTLGGDGNYYLTGSSGDNIWAYTKGVEL
jgi:hypothetical protein